MGALTSNRKRKDECFKLNSPILGFNSSDSNCDYFRDRIDCHIAKKARVSYCEGASEVVDTAERVVSRLRRYPEPEKLKREVHAPCRSSRVGFLSGRSRWENSGIRDKVVLMGNALLAEFNRKKNVALNALKHVRYGPEKEVTDVDAEEEAKSGSSKDLWEVEVIEDGNEVRSVVSEDCRGVENDVVELDRKGVERGSVRGFSIVPDLVKVEDDYKSLGSMSLDREAYKNLLSRVERTRTVKLNDLHFEITSVEARLQSIRLEKPKGKKFIDLVEPEEDLLREPFVPLTEEEGREVARALSQSNRRKILVSHENSNIEITGEMLQCLRPGAWLNDEVINLYLELLKEREKREPKKFLKCHFFNTFFYKKLVGGRNGYDYKAVRRWTTQRKLGYELMDCDKIFVPVHKEVHWCLAVINKRDKSLQYLDSLGGRDHQVLRALARYFMDEVKDKSGKDVDVSSWDQEFVEDLPEQQNGFDCGVFMIKYIDFYSRGLGLHFSQENMPYFRLRTAKEILKLRAD